MSLVNDALRKAKQTTPKTGTPSVGPMRLAEPDQRYRGSGFLLSMLVLVILLLAGLLVWQWFRGDSQLQVRANTRPEAGNPVSSPPAGRNKPVVARPNPATASDKPATTNLIAVEPPKPAVIAYKLQSVLFLGDPSAVINGKTVIVNSSVDGARVVAIAPGTATIVTSDGQTNVLVMH